ncbi:MAG TPA: superoxide dismutase [Sandaracinaceae bacterium LLY-WYZ-13_1]|nr:superoxide dismutase [Sandaracinaceae bacterium LLY-WYZ-13_1]
MAFTLPELPYSKDALAPHISAETLEFHHGKHHAGYVKKLNAALESESSLQDKSLEDLIKTQKAPGIFNNAAQVWNHTFYWNSMSPNGGGEPSGAIADAINKAFGSFSDFKEQFSKAAAGHFGSGWAWLVKSGDSVEIVDTHDANNPLTMDKKPILTVDVWEHAYYIDYRNARPKYLEAWWNLVNWDHANQQLG